MECIKCFNTALVDENYCEDCLPPDENPLDDPVYSSFDEDRKNWVSSFGNN